MKKNFEKLFKCLVATQKTLSICSKCLECCTEDEKKLFGELSEDAARMIQKLKSEFESH